MPGSEAQAEARRWLRLAQDDVRGTVTVARPDQAASLRIYASGRVMRRQARRTPKGWQKIARGCDHGVQRASHRVHPLRDARILFDPLTGSSQKGSIVSRWSCDHRLASCIPCGILIISQA